MDVNIKKLHDFIQERLDNDRVVYDCQEVEQFIRQAWFAGFADAMEQEDGPIA